MTNHTCKRCGYQWTGKDNVKACPRCKSYQWDTPRKDDQNEKEEGK